eukprot:TRINITY_DN24329_c0_g1_i1.p1 TRINITY_DN24329_c0_g1~~TRINITY_DN24329_c0_g1_i1.p1  ORF type:complete len:232 (-),score=45.25 TRINITY_DN24329_c0_g1_i1:375-1001(-)
MPFSIAKILCWQEGSTANPSPAYVAIKVDAVAATRSSPPCGELSQRPGIDCERSKQDREQRGEDSPEAERRKGRKRAATVSEMARLAEILGQALQQSCEESRQGEEEREGLQEAGSVLLPEEKTKLEQFLAQNAFKGPNVRRSSCYPLHSAVKRRNAEMVRILLACGATADVKDGLGYTPLQLAEKINIDGSHKDVIKAFKASAIPVC